jgi:hypothetical protein
MHSTESLRAKEEQKTVAPLALVFLEARDNACTHSPPSHIHSAQMDEQGDSQEQLAGTHELERPQPGDKDVCAAQEMIRMMSHNTFVKQGISVGTTMFSVAVRVIAMSTASWEREEVMLDLFGMESRTARTVMARVED